MNDQNEGVIYSITLEGWQFRLVVLALVGLLVGGAVRGLAGTVKTLRKRW
jgi:hypothetical protein